MGRARETGVVTFSFHDPRAFSTDKHRHVDDRPYGGGPGMVMQGEPVARALRSIERPGRMLLMTPGGRPFNQAWRANWPWKRILPWSAAAMKAWTHACWNFFLWNR